MIIIYQGKPESSYFYIVQPPGMEINRGEEIKCINPKSNAETVGVVTDKFTYQWTQVPDSFCLLNYGCNTLTVKKGIESIYPELQNQPDVRFLLIREK
jgi:hypothetical protein